MLFSRSGTPCSINQRHELSDIDRLKWDASLAPNDFANTRRAADHVATAAGTPPFDAILRCNRLQFLDAPAPSVASDQLAYPSGC